MNIGLTPLKSLLTDARPKHFNAGQLLLYAGDPPVETLILQSGIVKVFDIDDKGQEKVLQIIKAPAILPLDSFFTVPRNVSWHYGALTDVDASAFLSEELHARLKSNPELSAYIINWLAVESRELLVRIGGMSKSDAKDKVVTVLSFFSVYYTGSEKRGWKRIEFPITHQLIADIAGIARESATIQLGHLQTKKIIRSRRPYIELNVGRLIKYAENES